MAPTYNTSKLELAVDPDLQIEGMVSCMWRQAGLVHHLHHIRSSADAGRFFGIGPKQALRSSSEGGSWRHDGGKHFVAKIPGILS